MSHRYALHFDPEKVQKINTSNLSGHVLKALYVNNCYTTRQISDGQDIKRCVLSRISRGSIPPH